MKSQFRISQDDDTRITGIINVTPDSFYDGGRVRADTAIEHGLRLAGEGAHILDVGGESTRPGAESVPLSTELERVIPVIEALSEKTGLPISVDTRKAEVADKALDAGAVIINDVSAGLNDPEILAVAAEKQAHYIAMHMRGIPKTMQANTDYNGLISEILQYLEERINAILEAKVPRNKVIIDPGIGFGKSPEHNYKILASIDIFKRGGFPLLVGPSRKSFLDLAGASTPEIRLPGTLAAVTLCALAGVELVRVHDVAESLQAVKVALKVKKSVPT